MNRRYGAVLLVVMTAALLGSAMPVQAGSLGLGGGLVEPKVATDSYLWLVTNLRFGAGAHLAIEPEGGFWRTHKTPIGGKTESWNAGANLLAVLPTDRVSLFAGGGAGAHGVRASAPGFARVQRTRFGWQVVGGLDLKLAGGVFAFAALRYERIRAQELDPQYGQTKMYGGLRLRL
jgi:hypothetical protein